VKCGGDVSNYIKKGLLLSLSAKKENNKIGEHLANCKEDDGWKFSRESSSQRIFTIG